MPSEVSFNAPSKHKSLESLKETFAQRLSVILSKQLTIENVEVFADEALDETIKLIDDILEEYNKNPNFNARPTTLNIKEQENEALGILGLPSIPEVLERINELKEEIEELKKYINSHKEKINTVITPPQDRRAEITPGSGTFSKKEIFSRLLMLVYILQHDFDIPPTDVKMKEGKVTPEMMRKTPYVRIEIPSLDRAVYICDEEGNVSYVFDTKKLAERQLTLEDIDVDDKRDKNSLIAYYPGIGVRLVQSQNWRDRMSETLGEPIAEVETRIKEEIEEDIVALGELEEKAPPLVSKGELDPWRGFWTDPVTGEHWGTRTVIAKKLGRTVIVFDKRGEDKRLKTIPIQVRGNRSNRSRIEKGYCFEKILELFPELQFKNRVETEGEWRGFWTDPETGKHWAPAGTFLDKFKVNGWKTCKMENWRIIR